MRTEADGTITYFPLDSGSSEVAVAWHLEMPNYRGNIMAMVFRDSPNDPWKTVVRIRYYVDDVKDSTSKDKRHGWMLESPPDKSADTVRQDMIEGTDSFFHQMMDLLGGRLYRFDDHKSTEELLDNMAKQPFANLRVISKEEWDGGKR